MTDLIESFYLGLRDRGQQAQLDLGFATHELAAAFAATVADLRARRAGGSFFPEGTRAPMYELARARGGRGNRIADTQHVQALLWQPPRWKVAGDRSLDFEFLARELTPVSSVGCGEAFLADGGQRPAGQFGRVASQR